MYIVNVLFSYIKCMHIDFANTILYRHRGPPLTLCLNTDLQRPEIHLKIICSMNMDNFNVTFTVVLY